MMHWRLIDADRIAWRSWQEEVVVYSTTRATTHHVGAAAGSVLMALLEHDQSMSVDEIFTLAFAESSLDGAAALTSGERESVLSILNEFERTRLVERVAA